MGEVSLRVKGARVFVVADGTEARGEFQTLTVVELRRAVVRAERDAGLSAGAGFEFEREAQAARGAGFRVDLIEPHRRLDDAALHLYRLARRCVG